MSASNRFTAGRFLQAFVIAKGNPVAAVAVAEGQGQWTDRAQIVRAAAVTPMETGDFPGALVPVADSFLGAMRPHSIPLQLRPNLRETPMLTRIFVNAAGVVAVQVTEGAAIPVLKGDWTVATLTPRKFAGIVVITNELARSTKPTATLALTDDLAKATAEAENRAFISPDETGSVLDGAPSFPGTGPTLANIDADLRALVDLVPGASRIGAAFVMTKETATYLSLLRGTGGALAYPEITPQGGKLMGLPVLISTACQQVGSPVTRIVGLLSPSEIFWADDGKVILTASNQAALSMSDAPGGTDNLVSMWQTEATALKAIRESSWYARAGSGAYFTAGF